jgi:hypothetical protein
VKWVVISAKKKKKKEDKLNDVFLLSLLIKPFLNSVLTRINDTKQLVQE